MAGSWTKRPNWPRRARSCPGSIPRHFTLETIGEAYRAIADGTAEGKLVVEVDPAV
jgi:hypothetical protein